MAKDKDKFTVDDLDQELQRRSRKASAARPKARPQNAYPNADRYSEDGRRLYSAYGRAETAPAKAPDHGIWFKRVRGIAALILFALVTLIIVIAIRALP